MLLKSLEHAVVVMISFYLQVTVEGQAYHKSCFKCSHGGCAISPSNYAALEGILYCKHHFSQLFKEKGSYNHLIKCASVKRAEAQPAPPPAAADSSWMYHISSEAWGRKFGSPLFYNLLVCHVPVLRIPGPINFVSSAVLDSITLVNHEYHVPFKEIVVQVLIYRTLFCWLLFERVFICSVVLLSFFFFWGGGVGVDFS